MDQYRSSHSPCSYHNLVSWKPSTGAHCPRVKMYMRYANRLCCITTTLTICTNEQLHLTQPSFLQFLKIVFINTTIQFATFECTSLRTTIYRQHLSESIYYCIFDSFFFKLLEFYSQWKNSCSFSPIFFDFRCMVCIGEISTFHQRYFISNINQLLNVIAILRKWMSSSIIIQMKCEKNISPVGFHI